MPEVAHVTVIVVQGGKTTIVVLPQMENFEMYRKDDTPRFIPHPEFRNIDGPKVQEIGFMGKPIPDDNGHVYYQINPDQMVPSTERG